MQKHNEWLSNKGYLRHLKVLSKISQRKTHSLNRKCALRQQLNNTHSPTQPQETSLPRDSTGKRDNSIREQQLLWDNYYLGKRIIETPPVISKKKLDQEYKRHKMIITSMATSSSRRTIPTDFRVKKLQEFKENLEMHSQDLAQQQAVANHNFICVAVTGLSFYREKHVLDNLSLMLAYVTRSGKRHRQSCESFPAGDLLERSFCFGISKRLMNNEEALLLQIRNLKGLELFSIGCASFPSALELTAYKAQLYHTGKPIGEVEISTAYNRRVR